LRGVLKEEGAIEEVVNMKSESVASEKKKKHV
jgi:hypothetical protein